MIRLTEIQQKAASSLRMNPSFIKILDLLEAEKQISISGLLKAKEENVLTLQGRARVLDELVTALKESQ